MLRICRSLPVVIRCWCFMGHDVCSQLKQVSVVDGLSCSLLLDPGVLPAAVRARDRLCRL